MIKLYWWWITVLCLKSCSGELSHYSDGLRFVNRQVLRPNGRKPGSRCRGAGWKRGQSLHLPSQWKCGFPTSEHAQTSLRVSHAFEGLLVLCSSLPFAKPLLTALLSFQKVKARKVVSVLKVEYTVEGDNSSSFFSSCLKLSLKLQRVLVLWTF